MKLRYSTPLELVEALLQRVDGARAQLWQELRQSVTRLMDELVRRHQITSSSGERIVTHALHLAETFLRTRSIAPFASMTWAAFRAAILLRLVKLVIQPFGAANRSAGDPSPLPESTDYHSQTFFKPHDRRGEFSFGGDWFAGRQAGDGSLWVLVADVTGHGYAAYLVATALPTVWQTCWDTTSPSHPAAFLASMHHLLEDCLPDGVFAECTLVRLAPDGETTVAPAGGTRLLLRCGTGKPQLYSMRGTWLGLSAPSPADQRSWTLARGDELLLGTDGVFDQLTEYAGKDVLSRLPDNVDLFDAVERLLHQTLEHSPQRDDLTMVLLRRRARVEDEPIRRELSLFSPHESGDVPL